MKKTVIKRFVSFFDKVIEEAFNKGKRVSAFYISEIWVHKEEDPTYRGIPIYSDKPFTYKLDPSDEFHVDIEHRTREEYNIILHDPEAFK